MGITNPRKADFFGDQRNQGCHLNAIIKENNVILYHHTGCEVRNVEFFGLIWRENIGLLLLGN